MSLAPRYIGDFEKGVDYKGDVAALERSLRDHAAIAETARAIQAQPALGFRQALDVPGPGSGDEGPVPRQDGRDKLPGGARGSSPDTTPRCSAGSSTSPAAATTKDKATYHVSATLASAPPAEDVSDIDRSGAALPRTMVRRPARARFHEAGRGRSSIARSARF